MTRQVRVVAYGRPASQALADAIATAKHGKPLAPVTVVVASNLAGLSARRLLGGGRLGGSGIANVAFVTPFRLAELLAADLLFDRAPLTNPVLGAAIRRTLGDEPGPFAEVAGHHATETALAALYGELSHVSETTLRALEVVGGTAADSVAIFRRIATRLAGFHGEDDTARAAAGRTDLADVVAPLGHIIWFLPAPVTPALTELIRTVLSVATTSSVIVGAVGDSLADEAVLATCRQAGVDLPAPSVEQTVGSHILSVTDADEEVRAVVRRVAALAEAGVPLDRIGVFHPTPDPYVRILQQQFAEAGIPANGPSRQGLADTAAGRTLLAALALPGERWRRDRVMALVSGGPIRHGDGRTRPAAWEELSRRGGVLGGLTDWRDKLAGVAAGIDTTIADLDPSEQAGRIARLERDRADAMALADFVAGLAAGVQAITDAADWSAKAAAVQALLRDLLGSEGQRPDWPEAELDAAGRIEDGLIRLSLLDELQPDPSIETFRRALQSELDVPHGRVGRFGQGVVYGPLVSAAGFDLDAVFILGMAEGTCPTPRRDDPLLPSGARALSQPGELWTTTVADQHRAFLAALAAAPSGRRWLVFPRGDQRGRRHRLPSRWLLDTATALAGQPVYSTEFADLGPPVVDVVASYGSGIVTAPSPASLLDRDLATLTIAAAAGCDLMSDPAVGEARRGFDCVAARRSAAFTEWDGNLAGRPVPSPAGGQVLSPTRLQRWASCGYRYFLADVLGLGARDDPEAIIDLSALDRGSAVHAILEAFLLEVIAAGPPDPQTPWTTAQRDRVQTLATDVFAELEQRGRTGRPVRWRLEQERLRALLDGFLTSDDQHRSATGSRPAGVEVPFGLDGAAPVTIPLPDGRTVAFRGRADRIDADEGGVHYVADYKTGAGRSYLKLEEGDPTRGGTLLQLGLYAEVALQLLGAGAAQAHYWMVDEGARFERRGYPWDEPRRQRFLEVLAAIVDGIDRGMFAAIPGEWDGWRNTHDNCTWCDFDSVCPRDRGEYAEGKAAAPEFAVRAVLAGDASDGGAGE